MIVPQAIVEGMIPGMIPGIIPGMIPGMLAVILPASPLSMAIVFLLGWLATHVVLRVVTERGIVDAPNDRSSHSAPTPRAGGSGFALLGTLILFAVAIRSGSLAPWCIAIVGAAVAWIGLRDDADHVPARVRLGVHLGAALLVALLAWPFSALGIGVPLGLLLLPLVVVAIAWMISVVNFMDGLDGLAAANAVLVAGVAAMIFAGGPAAAPALASALIAAALLGFLMLNWPPARLFMGDVGSGWIGVVFAGLAVWSVREAGWAGLWPWLILGATFISDATICLLRRMLTGQPFTEAHRSHAYQNLSRLVGSHRTVTIGFLVVGLLWSMPLAVIASRQPNAGLMLTLIAYAPTALAAFLLRSGVPGVADATKRYP